MQQQSEGPSEWAGCKWLLLADDEGLLVLAPAARNHSDIRRSKLVAGGDGAHSLLLALANGGALAEEGRSAVAS